MQIDLDTKLTAMFLFGMAGLIEQAVAQMAFGQSDAGLAGVFGTLMVTGLGFGAARGSRDNRNGADGEPARPRDKGRGERE